MAERQIIVKLLADAREFKAKLGEATAETETFGKKMRAASAVAGLAIGGLLVEGLKKGTEGILEQQAADQKLIDTLSRVPKSVRPAASSLIEYAEAQQKTTAFTREQTEATEAFLVRQDGVQRAVKSGVASFEDLTGVTENLATVLGVSGPAAAATLARALGEPDKAVRALRQAGVTLTAQQQAGIKAWVKHGDMAKAQAFILDKLRKKTDGAADAYGKTLPGKIAIAKASFGEVQKHLAAGLLPVITKVLNQVLKFSAWAETHQNAVRAMAAAVGVLAAGFIGLSIAEWAASLTPVGLIIGGIALAIAALAAAFVYAWRKSETFRKVVVGVINGIKNVIVDWVQINTFLILGFFDLIISGAAKAFGWIPGLGGMLKSANEKFDSFSSGVSGALNAIKDRNIHINGDASGLIQAVRDATTAYNAAGFQGPALPTNFGVTGVHTSVSASGGGSIPSFGAGGGGGGGSSLVKKSTISAAKAGQEIIKALVHGMDSQNSKVTKLLDALGDKMKAKFQAFVDQVQKARDTSAQAMSTLAASLNAPGDDGSVLGQLAKQAADTEKLKTTLAGLAKDGLRKDLLSQLFAGGLSSLPAAQQLLAGGSASVGMANRLDKSINGNARAIGNAEALRTTGVGLGANGTTIIKFAPSGNAVIDALMGEIKKYVRTNGGSHRVFVQ